MRHLIKRFDDLTDEAFAPLRGRSKPDIAFYVASEAADYSVAWHIIGVSMAIVSPARRRDAVRLAVMLGVESLVVNGGLKRLTKRDRPELDDDRAFEVRRPKTSSFPSGHASSAALMASLMSDAAPKLKPVWLTLAAIVSASRVHNRMHHGSDVLAGSVLGAAFGVATKRFWPLDRP